MRHYASCVPLAVEDEGGAVLFVALRAAAVALSCCTEEEVEGEREKGFGLAPRRVPLGASAFLSMSEIESRPARAVRQVV
jgi:hypothetical protein